MEKTDHELLTIEEAADFLRLSRNTVYALCRRGAIPASQIGRKWRIRRADLERLLGGDTADVSARPIPEKVRRFDTDVTRFRRVK